MRPHSSDARLVRRGAEGDSRAFAAIYRRYDQRLYRYCLSIVGNAEDAQDALQNAMLKIMRALPGETREIQLKPWLYRIAHNESIELLRRRREQVELSPELASSGGGPAETAALRERLRGLLDDVSQLPERQRGALLMRELAGLDFEEIGTAFQTSAAVARQTLYEARLSLGQLQAGRAMSCEKVMRELSDGDGRVTRRREIQAHLRDCAECREFGEAIATRHHDLAAIAPLPAAASSALLHALLAGGESGAGSLTGGGLAAGAGKAALGSVAMKSAATVAAVAVIGAGVADRSGLIGASGPGGDRAQSGRAAETAPPRADGNGGTAATQPGEGAGTAGGKDGRAVHSAAQTPGQGDVRQKRGGGAEGASPQADAPAKDDGVPATKELPAASAHGQETAASHGGGRGHASHGNGGNSHGQGNSHSQAPSEPPGQAKSKPAQAHGPPSQHPEHPSTPPNKGVGPDSSSSPPLQPSEPQPRQGPPEAAGNRPSKEAR